jgi:hypothetical protein
VACCAGELPERAAGPGAGQRRGRRWTAGRRKEEGEEGRKKKGGKGKKEKEKRKIGEKENRRRKIVDVKSAPHAKHTASQTKLA